MRPTHYQRGQRVRFIRNSRLHLAPKKGRIPGTNKQWERGRYLSDSFTRRGWHRILPLTGELSRRGVALVVPSRRLRPEKQP